MYDCDIFTYWGHFSFSWIGRRLLEPEEAPQCSLSFQLAKRPPTISAGTSYFLATNNQHRYFFFGTNNQCRYFFFLAPTTSIDTSSFWPATISAGTSYFWPVTQLQILHTTNVDTKDALDKCCSALRFMKYFYIDLVYFDKADSVDVIFFEWNVELWGFLQQLPSALVERNAF